MEIREANSFDKIPVLKFCKDTFSWGDYVDKVWSSWLEEGNLFYLKNNFQLAYVMHFILKIKSGLKELELILILERKRLLQNLLLMLN